MLAIISNRGEVPSPDIAPSYLQLPSVGANRRYTSPAHKAAFPGRVPSDRGEAFWIVPGGGLEPGESFEQALRRELREELGLRTFEIGTLVWRRQHTFNWDGKRICQRETYHVVDVNRFEPRMSDGTEARTLDQFRWWHASELVHAKERLTPLSLASIVASYLILGALTGLPEWEILVD